MPGLVPGIHVFLLRCKEDVDAGTSPAMTERPLIAARSAKAALRDWQDTIAGGAPVQMPRTLPDWRPPE
jgi:hypothetical protein